jgi:hypothetical protein
MTTPDYKTIALRLYAHAKFAEDSDLGIPWPPAATVQCERPASYELLTP